MRELLSKILVLAVSIGIALFFLSFSNNSAPLKSTLLNAMQKNIVQTEAVSNGKYSGYSVVISITNTTNSPLEITIPAGTLYYPENEEEQTLIQLNEEFIAIKPKETYHGQIVAFCTEADNSCPTESKSFVVKNNQDPKLAKLVNYMQGKRIDKKTLQDAVWAVSDNHSVANINATDATGKAFREYIAELTGQENTWYTTPQRVQIDNDGNFILESVTINGRIAFDCKTGGKVYQDIHKANGEVYMKTDQPMIPPVNHMEMDFRLRVRGWEKGDYYISLNDGNNELARFDFTL